MLSISLEELFRGIALQVISATVITVHAAKVTQQSTSSTYLSPDTTISLQAHPSLQNIFDLKD